MVACNLKLAPLPRIVRFLGVDDSPDSTCPHCGATGRYLIRFIVEDGRQLGAMRGCVRLYPQSPICREELRLRQKLQDRAKYGWQLNRADRDALAAIEQYHAGQLDERAAMSAVATAKALNVARARARGK